MMTTLMTGEVAAVQGESVEEEDEQFVYLENCTETSQPVVNVFLHKDRPNNIYRVNLFEKFPEKQVPRCRTSVYAQVVEFYEAWHKRRLTPHLRNYKVMATLEDINMPLQCDKVYSLVSDAQKNHTTLCQTLDNQIYNYRFILFYRRDNLTLLRDYFIDLSLAVAYLPPKDEEDSTDRGCPSDAFFQCETDRLCIPSRFWCDQVSHCSDNSDEGNCDLLRQDTDTDASTEGSTVYSSSHLAVPTVNITTMSISKESERTSAEVNHKDDTDDNVNDTSSTEGVSVSTQTEIAIETTETIIYETTALNTFLQREVTTVLEDNTDNSLWQKGSTTTTPITIEAIANVLPTTTERQSLFTFENAMTYEKPIHGRDAPRYISIAPSSLDSYEEYDSEPVATAPTATTPATPWAASASSSSRATSLSSTVAPHGSSALHTSSTRGNIINTAKIDNYPENYVPYHLKPRSDSHADIILSTKGAKSTTAKPNPAPYPFGPRSDRLDSRNSSSHSQTASIVILAVGVRLALGVQCYLR